MMLCSRPAKFALAAVLVAFLASGFAGVAQAHIGAHVGAHAGGLVSGLAHPFSGLDHVLAMLAVGIWASQLGRPAWWLLPATFPAVMMLGASFGLFGMALPGVEPAIAASVLVLGALIAFAARPSLPVSVALIALLALVHGYGHGLGIPAQTSAAAYGAGFVMATLMLHAAGLAVGAICCRMPLLIAARATGALIAVVGALLLNAA